MAHTVKIAVVYIAVAFIGFFVLSACALAADVSTPTSIEDITGGNTQFVMSFEAMCFYNYSSSRQYSKSRIYLRLYNMEVGGENHPITKTGCYVEFPCPAEMYAVPPKTFIKEDIDVGEDEVLEISLGALPSDIEENPELAYQIAADRINTMPIDDLVTIKSSTSVGDDDEPLAWDDLPTLTRQIQQMIEDLARTADVHIDALTAELMGLIDDVAGVSSLTGSQIGVLNPPLTKLREKLKAGTLTQTEIDLLTQEFINARSNAFAGTETEETGINWQRLTTAWGGLANVFPFCIPADLVNMIRGFEKEAVRPPIVRVNIVPFIEGNAGEVTLDLAMPEFEDLRKLVRIGMLMLFCVGLALLTSKVIKW